MCQVLRQLFIHSVWVPLTPSRYCSCATSTKEPAALGPQVLRVEESILRQVKQEDTLDLRKELQYPL